MPNEIWKYPWTKGQSISMPKHARIVHLGIQNKVVTLWAIVDPEQPRTTRAFTMVGTGEPLPNDWIYIGTWQSPPFVWHLGEVNP